MACIIAIDSPRQLITTTIQMVILNKNVVACSYLIKNNFINLCKGQVLDHKRKQLNNFVLFPDIMQTTSRNGGLPTCSLFVGSSPIKRGFQFCNSHKRKREGRESWERDQEGDNAMLSLAVVCVPSFDIASLLLLFTSISWF